MTDLDGLLPLWRELEAEGRDYVLATVVAVRGSSYRKPGARMLLASDGRRAGTISGGCLEAEVARRAWWLTASGPAIADYSTAGDDEEDRPKGSGCDGIVTLLLERRATASALFPALENAFRLRQPLAIATLLEGRQMIARALATPGEVPTYTSTLQDERLGQAAEKALQLQAEHSSSITLKDTQLAVWTDYRPARFGLWIFGAGDDAFPLVKMAQTLGWFVTVADGRGHLLTRSRFPHCDALLPLDVAESPLCTRSQLDLRPGDAAVLMTHSFQQDAHILAALLGDGSLPIAYTGVLGSAQRTRRLLGEVAHLLSSAPSLHQHTIDSWMQQLYSPIGLDLGNDTPAEIALCILAEVKMVCSATGGESLRKVKALAPGTRPDRNALTSCLQPAESAI